MKVISIFIILLSFSAYAEKKMTTKDLSMLGKIDESTMKADPVKPEIVTSTTTSKISINCKDSSGKEFTKEDAGYESCLAGIKGNHNLEQKNKNLNQKKSNDGNSANFNFKIGE